MDFMISPVPSFVGKSCCYWWGGSRMGCQTSSGTGTPCAPVFHISIKISEVGHVNFNVNGDNNDDG